MDKSVAIVVCAWPPQGGGIGNNAYYQAIKLSQRGWRVGVFTPAFSGMEQGDERITIHKLKTFFNIGKAGFMLGLGRELKNYGVVHLYYPFFGSDLLVWRFKIKNPQIKLVLHYEMDPIGEGWKRLVFALYIKFFLGRLVAAADKIAALSFDHASHSYLAKHYAATPDKFVELPNGIDTGLFRPQEKNAALMNSLSILPQDKVVIFVGGLDSQHYFKGVPALLRAFKSLPVNYFPDVLMGGVQRGTLQELRGQAKLLIVGDGNLRQEFERLADALGIAERTVFCGWIKNESLAQYYALADVFVLPSIASTESFGIVVAEAQACGVAAVVSDWPGVRTTLEDGVTGLLAKPGDIHDLTIKLKTILTDSKLSRRLGDAGSRRAAEKYDWEIVVSAMERIYEKL